MSQDDELLPLKRVLELTGVSRSTLWRVSQSGLDGFPKPKARGRRLFWRADDLAAIRRCIEAFDGRTVFDRRAKKERQRKESRHAALSEMKRSRRTRVPRTRRVRAPGVQGDLFNG